MFTIGQKCRGHLLFFGSMFFIIYKQPVGDVYIIWYSCSKNEHKPNLIIHDINDYRELEITQIMINPIDW